MKTYLAGFLLGLTCCCGTVAAANIQSFQLDSFDLIKKHHAGKSFVVMVWSLDCAYCLDSFRALEQVRQKWKVDVVTIATDRVDDTETATLIGKKLRAGGLQSQAWAYGDVPADQLKYRIDSKWRGELPRSYWFDAQGKSVAHSGVITNALARKHFNANGRGRP